MSTEAEIKKLVHLIAATEELLSYPNAPRSYQGGVFCFNRWLKHELEVAQERQHEEREAAMRLYREQQARQAHAEREAARKARAVVSFVTGKPIQATQH